ncbi:MAG: hypothetical protein DMD45_04795 [Gemmatimonadetes bacterium]|nr:MAG: hypothetical protein DMD45_04795 [Gemmatimonadota bacterium]
MPVTATLSRKFYEKFGDDLTNELVNWLNQVDATYRSDLRDLNEVNFARFDAKLEQRATQLDAKIEQRTAWLDAKLEQRIAEVKAAMAALESRLEARMSAFEARIIRWMFLFWVGQAVTTVGLVFGVVRLVGR